MAEGNFSISDEFHSVKQVMDGDFKKRNTKFMMSLDPSVPFKVRASRSSFRQILWNLLQAQINYSNNATVEMTARQSRPTEIVIEVKGDKNKLNNDQMDEVQQICLAEELSTILQSPYIDINLKIALILARQHGWPIDFIYNHWSTKFVLVVTVTPVEEQRTEVQPAKV